DQPVGQRTRSAMSKARSTQPLTRAQVREIDRRAIEEFGVPGIVLMENAGRGAAERILAVFSGAQAGLHLILCGGGNNGGDGFVIAPHLAKASRGGENPPSAEPVEPPADTRAN